MVGHLLFAADVEKNGKDFFFFFRVGIVVVNERRRFLDRRVFATAVCSILRLPDVMISIGQQTSKCLCLSINSTRANNSLPYAWYYEYLYSEPLAIRQQCMLYSYHIIGGNYMRMYQVYKHILVNTTCGTKYLCTKYFVYQVLCPYI